MATGIHSLNLDDRDLPLSRLCERCEIIIKRELWGKRAVDGYRSSKKEIPQYPVSGSQIEHDWFRWEFPSRDREFAKVNRRHHDSFASVFQAAREQCAICVHISDILRGPSLRSSSVRAYTDGTIYEVEQFLAADDPFSIEFISWLDACKTARVKFRITENSSIERMGYTSMSWSSTGNTYSVPLIRRWLQECLHEHKLCNKAAVPREYPTRLLRIGRKQVQLVECASDPLEGPYTTLSHCWGPEPFPVLTTETYPQFRSGIPIADLPPTFRDAVQTSLNLEIFLIWIDCYCIIQSGAKADWTGQAPKMQQVYANAILNIGAAHAGNPHGGCYAERSAVLPAAVRLSNSCAESPNVVLITVQKETYGDPIRNAHQALELSPLMQRAWVLQERVLASRVLYYEASQISWECSTTFRNESFPNGIQLADAWATPVAPMGCSWDRFSGLDKDYRLELLSGLWREFFEGYTRSNLSNPDDKLIAIQSIATRISQALGCPYNKGFFDDHLPVSLLWQANVHGAPLTPQRQRGPTWSWVSVDGPLDCPLFITPYEMRTGSMWLTSVSWPEHSDTLFCLGRILKMSLPESRRVQALFRTQDDMWDDAHFDFSNFPVSLEFNIMWDLCEEFEGKLALLPVLGMAYGTSIPKFYGLVLRCHEDGTYTRLGVFQSDTIDRGSIGLRRISMTSFFEQFDKIKPQMVEIR